MEKLRDMLGGWTLFFLIIIFEVILVYIIPEHPYICTFISIALALAIFYVINKLADLKELERITAQQNAFNKEFDYFKTMYAMQLETMPYLYPIIDLAQTNTLDLCRRYPDKYKNEKDFKKTTIRIILSLFDGHIHANRYWSDPNEKEIKKFMEDIKRRERLS